MVEKLKDKLVMISEYVNMVVELDTLLLDDMTRDDNLLEQIEGDEVYADIVDIEKLKSHVNNVRRHLDSGILLEREVEYVYYIHEDVKHMLDNVKYLQARNDRLEAGFEWIGIDETIL